MLRPVLFSLCLLAQWPLVHAASACRHPFSGAELSELIAHSDTRQLTDFASAQSHLARVEQILLTRQDHRAIFAVFYRNILSTAVPAVRQGGFKDPVWADRVSLEFVRRYLNNFHWHIRGRSDLVTPTWNQFYKMTESCDRSVGRKATSALTAHLVIDFPEAINDAASKPKNFGDFYAFGTLLTQVTLNIAGDLKQIYGYDMSPFFRLYFLGEIIDSVTAPDTTSTVFFQAIRTNSWNHGMALRTFFIPKSITRSAMNVTWGASNIGLNTLEQLKFL